MYVFVIEGELLLNNELVLKSRDTARVSDLTDLTMKANKETFFLFIDLAVVSNMLLIRHAIGSRLFYQTENFEIQLKGNMWMISVSIPADQIEEIIKFKEELNLFVVGENEKTWFYSSNAEIDYQDNVNQLVILADHKTVYPV